MSRNARSNSKVRIDKISSNQVNVDGLNAFGEFSQIRQSEISSADLTTSFRQFSFLHTFLDVSLKLYIEKKNNWQRSCTPFGYEEGTALYIYIYKSDRLAFRMSALSFRDHPSLLFGF